MGRIVFPFTRSRRTSKKPTADMNNLLKSTVNSPVLTARRVIMTNAVPQEITVKNKHLQYIEQLDTAAPKKWSSESDLFTAEPPFRKLLVTRHLDEITWDYRQGYLDNYW